MYELHIGSFTPEGTFKAATPRLRHIRDLGCTALTVMPIQQDWNRWRAGNPDWWGYDVISCFAVDFIYGTPADVVAFIAEAHHLGLAVVIDYVINHMVAGAETLVGPQFFVEEQTAWGPRPNFAKPYVRRYALDAAEFYLSDLGFDGLRVDSTKSIRKFPSNAPDAHGGGLLGELTALCRRCGKLAIAEDLEDGAGLLQLGGLGFHLQWDMAFFCWVYEALVTPWDEGRDMERVKEGLQGLSPSRSHSLRGRVLFMESHDTAPKDRYGRFPAAVHHGKAFMAQSEGGGGDAFQQSGGAALPYPNKKEVEANRFAARRAALGLTLMMCAPGVPMLLQGQEVYEIEGFEWPRGPRLDWARVAAAAAAAGGGGGGGAAAGTWCGLLRNLIKLRQERNAADAEAGRPGPLVGDGLHVFHAQGGVIAFLRWFEVEDSRMVERESSSLALVVMNCTNTSYPSYELGVPPSRTWRLALCTVKGAGLSSGEVAPVHLETIPGHPNHDFPFTLNVTLPPYSATIFLRSD